MNVSMDAARAAQSHDDIADVAAQARDTITWLLADAQGLLELVHSADGVPDDVVAAAETSPSRSSTPGATSAPGTDALANAALRRSGLGLFVQLRGDQ